MSKRFTGIRLLLAFVAINLIMFLMLVTSMTSAHPWLARVLPGHFEAGVNSSGYWVFFALVLLVDAVAVLLAGLALLLPAMVDGAAAEERRLTRHLIDRGGISEETKEAIFVAMREEVVNAHYQIVAGRTILFAGAVFLVFAFFAVSLSFTRALPGGSMYATETGSVQNQTVRAWDIQLFTADQIAGAALLNAPDIYGWQFGTLENNSDNALYTNFVFTFRAITGFVLLLIVLSLLRRGRRPSREKKTIESVEAAAEEKKTA
ncbi:MAG: hypothetical protein KGM97_09555 [Alphaproteobacteria bacterium]|nr:hypothetical protein [Alphaproteobacteria bacterium]MDE2631221.1 hypothetical protein [Alphaproteobacteria bacterium]